MPIETYKGFEICEMWNKEKPYYIVCKEFKEDPFWEIALDFVFWIFHLKSNKG